MKPPIIAARGASKRILRRNIEGFWGGPWVARSVQLVHIRERIGHPTADQWVEVLSPGRFSTRLKESQNTFIAAGPYCRRRSKACLAGGPQISHGAAPMILAGNCAQGIKRPGTCRADAQGFISES